MRTPLPNRGFWRRLTLAPTGVLLAVAGLCAWISVLVACKGTPHR